MSQKLTARLLPTLLLCLTLVFWTLALTGCRHEDGPDAIDTGLLSGGAHYVGSYSDPAGSGRLDIRFPPDLLNDLGYGTLTLPSGQYYNLDVKPLQYPLRLAVNVRAKEDWLALGPVTVGKDGHLRGTLAKSFKNRSVGTVTIDLVPANAQP